MVDVPLSPVGNGDFVWPAMGRLSVDSPSSWTGRLVQTWSWGQVSQPPSPRPRPMSPRPPRGPCATAARTLVGKLGRLHPDGAVEPLGCGPAASDPCGVCYDERRAGAWVLCCKQSLCAACFVRLADASEDWPNPKKRCPFCRAPLPALAVVARDAVRESDFSLPPPPAEPAEPDDAGPTRRHGGNWGNRGISLPMQLVGPQDIYVMGPSQTVYH